jgi:molecular chaperone GrpE
MSSVHTTPEEVLEQEPTDIPTVLENETSAEAMAEDTLVAEPIVAGEGPNYVELEHLLAEEKDRYLRLAAEYDNYRRRTAREKDELYTRTAEQLLGTLLNVFDDIGRAQTAAEKSENIDAIRDGLRLVHKNFNQTLDKLGVRPVGTVGDAFDSERHDAIARMPVEDDTKKGTVIEVVKKGYLYHDRVLRVAQVLIGE